MRHRRIPGTLVAVCGFLLAFPHQGAERTRVVTGSQGSVPAEVESRLLLRGHRGEIGVRIGPPGEIRFQSVLARQPSPSGLPVEAWISGGTIEITPPEGAPPRSGVLEVVVPPRIFVEVEATDATVVVTGLRSGLEARGERLLVTARGIEGAVRLELTAGSAVVEGQRGDVSLSGSGIEARVTKVEGSVRTKVVDSSLEIREVTGALEADLSGTPLVLAGLAGPLRLRATGGTVALRGLKQGGEIVVSGTPIDLEESAGDVDVQTDAALRFRDSDIDLHVDSYGGSVHGTGNDGLLEVKTEGGEVVIDRVKGPTRVQGRRLVIDLQHVDGEIYVDAASSQITIGDAGAEVHVQSENGDVTVLRPATEVVVTSRGGDVRLLETRGPFRVEADGSRVEISLASPFALKDSEVQNHGGEVEVRIPPNLRLRVAAETRYGRIDSILPGFQVGDGVRTAEGKMGSGGGDVATLRIQAGGNILLGEKEPVGQ